MIHFEHVSKEFDGEPVLEDVSFEISEGALFGIVGPMGCGKTACLHIMGTLLPPDSGRVTIRGLDVTADQQQIRRQIGYVPDFFGLTRGITVESYLDFYASCAGIERRGRPERIQRLLDDLDLADSRDHGVGGLSRGRKQCLALAKACLHDPAVIILDEPATGLDPKTHSRIHAFLRGLEKDGRTVVVSSRTLSEIDVLCSHVAILKAGRLVRAGAMHEILQAARPQKGWCLDVAGDPGRLVSALSALDYVTNVALQGSLVTFSVDQLRLHEREIPGDALPPDVLDILSLYKLALRSATEDEMEIEEAFSDLASQLLG